MSPGVFAVTVAWFLLAPASAEEPAKSKPGPLDVETTNSLKLKAVKGGRELSYKIHFPKTGGPYPVIVFSHGFAGNQDSFAPIGTHWASHGYVVIHPTHADGRDRSKGVKKNGEDKSPQTRPGGLLGGMNDPQKISDRVADLVLILDNLTGLPKATPGLEGKIDANRVGVGGHSFGAYTAMLIGGVTVDLGKDKAKSFFDKRVRCLLPISAQGVGQQGLTEKSWNALTLPMMTVTGTRDRGAGGQGVDWKKEPYKYSPKGDKYLVVLNGAGHLSFGGGLGARNAAITDAVKLCTTHYWDAYLKGTEASKEYLQSERPAKDMGGTSTIDYK